MEESGSTPSNVEDFDAFRKLYARRNRALAQIMHNTRFGEVDGISFDLRHDDINRDEWEMNSLGFFNGVIPPHRDEELPFIWFPWYGKFDPELLRAEVVKEKYKAYKEYRKKEIPHEVFDNVTDEEHETLLESDHKFVEQLVRREIAGRTPDAIVNPGDCISIHNIQMRVYDDDKFIPIEDRAEIQVFVKITNVNGLCILLDRPIIMTGVSSLTYARGNKPIYSIMYRVKRHHKLDLRELPKEFWYHPARQGYAYSALSYAIKIHNKYLLRISKLERNGSDSSFRIGEKYLEALNSACMLGYYWAQFENEVSMRPLAESGSRSREGARSGGKNSGAVRAKRPWRLHAEELAREIKEENASVGAAGIASRILKRWKRTDIEKPNREQLRGHIRRMNKAGTLPIRKD